MSTSIEWTDATWNPTRGCTTGVRAARRHPGEVAARRHSWRYGALGDMVRHPPTIPAQMMDSARPPRRASPSARRWSPRRTTGGGRRNAEPAQAARSALCHPTGPPGSHRPAPAPRACRLRVGVAVRWPPDDAPGYGAITAWLATRRPARADNGCGPPSARHASPSAHRRSRRRQRAGGGTGRRHRLHSATFRSDGSRWRRSGLGQLTRL
jgi:hypothetical protein